MIVQRFDFIDQSKNGLISPQHRMRLAQVSFHHLLLEDHAIILAEGIPNEGFFAGDYILLADAGIRAELLALFPDLDPQPGQGGPQTARRRGAGAATRICHTDLSQT